MALPLFFPALRYTPQIDCAHAVPLHELCNRAETRCEAFGAWTKRPIVVCDAGEQLPWIRAEPGDWAAVEVGVPHLRGSLRAQSRWALGALAFVLFDGVARASIVGKDWSRIEQPRGAAPGGRRPLSNAERQRKYRMRAGV
ncbi:hypothetical protein RCH10_004582 [Variovorax sp. GrIS 2.14]|uniref:hypothetical protein n=1 Tax=Variovorax sp. GrIS 2.14 TaxID=3071709 RepID=UPI0038F79627